MKGKTAFEAMEGIDPRYILEAAPDAAVVVGRKTKFLRLTAVAAALALVAAVGAVMVPMLMKEPGIPTEDNIPVEKIYSVAQTHYNGTSLISDEEADVSLKTVKSQDENHPKIDTYTIKGTEYELSYLYSVFYPKAGFSEHSFELVGAQKAFLSQTDIKPRIDIRDDGSIAGIYLLDLGSIDMSHSDDDEDVIAAAEAIAMQYTDISRYEYAERKRSMPDSKGGFVIWYNEVGGKELPGTTTLAISDDGLVWAISIGFDYDFTLTEEQLPSNEKISEIVKYLIEIQNLCNVETVCDIIIEYDIIIFNGEFYAHTMFGFRYTEVLEDGTDRDQYGSLEYLIPITGASFSYGENGIQE